MRQPQDRSVRKCRDSCVLGRGPNVPRPFCGLTGSPAWPHNPMPGRLCEDGSNLSFPGVGAGSAVAFRGRGLCFRPVRSPRPGRVGRRAVGVGRDDLRQRSGGRGVSGRRTRDPRVPAKRQPPSLLFYEDWEISPPARGQVVRGRRSAMLGGPSVGSALVLRRLQTTAGDKTLFIEARFRGKRQACAVGRQAGESPRESGVTRDIGRPRGSRQTDFCRRGCMRRLARVPRGAPGSVGSSGPAGLPNARVAPICWVGVPSLGGPGRDGPAVGKSDTGSDQDAD